MLFFLAVSAAACMTARIRPGETAHLQVAENGVITFQGEALTLDKLPQTLKSAGATSKTPVQITVHGEVPERMLRGIVAVLERNGMRRIMIRGERRVSAYVEEEPPAPAGGRPAARPRPGGDRQP